MSAQPRRPRARSSSGAITEAAHQKHVIALARFCGWRIFHAPAGGTGSRAKGNYRVDREQVGRGFPDLVLLRPPRLILAELKPAQGAQRVTKGTAERRPGWLAHRDLDDAQADWLRELALVPGLEVHLWRPDDLEDIAQVLADGSEVDLDVCLSFARNFAGGEGRS